MKTYLPAPMTRMLALLLILSLLCALVACSTGSGDTSDDSLDEEAATLPPVTVPDLTDDRTLTDADSEAVMTKVLAAVQEQLGATLR